MAEPINRPLDDEEQDNPRQSQGRPNVDSYEDAEEYVLRRKRPGVVKRGFRKFKEDVSHSSQVEDGSLAQYLKEGFRAVFPKKNKKDGK